MTVAEHKSGRTLRMEIEVARDEGWADGFEGRDPRELAGVDPYCIQAYLNGYDLGSTQRGTPREIPLEVELALPSEIAEQHAAAYVITVCAVVVLVLTLVVVFGRG